MFERDEGPARVKLVVAYDGTGFRGWADQPDVRTVQGVLGRGLERFLRHQP
ncbi:MAG: tRNA pseudouridine(38-40) synthase TruA, partial [Actinomycetota bacterium]|nr:tRNA pseudouridine(38-40) synthase TruA [Actinomycetota bacterium]